MGVCTRRRPGRGRLAVHIFQYLARAVFCHDGRMTVDDLFAVIELVFPLIETTAAIGTDLISLIERMNDLFEWQFGLWRRTVTFLRLVVSW